MKTKAIFVIILVICCIVSASSAGTFSVLGDSWSTFFGYTTPEANTSWYPSWYEECEGYKSGNDVMSVKDTWWCQLTEYGFSLLENCSYSGSPICYDGYGDCNNDAANISFVTRVQSMKDVDLIIIQGGLNDSAVGALLGEYKYSDWTESDFVYFRPSLAYVIDYILSNTNSGIVFMKCEEIQEPYSTSIDEICDHYGVPVLSLHNIELTKWHPNKLGMEMILEQILRLFY